uniref:Adiponectin receptor protein n=1 Tax=Lepeophtheirus salmonis TaxID=72036 RepID=A0A0K2TLV0_LEPSM
MEEDSALTTRRRLVKGFPSSKKKSFCRSRKMCNKLKNGRMRRKQQETSPQRRVREMLEEAPEILEDVLERLMSNSSAMVHHSVQGASDMVHSVAQRIRDWKVLHFTHLPAWMKDNEHLHFGHRPELQSFVECFRSIFRIHTETGNIWTHLIGFIAMTIVAVVFYKNPLCQACSLNIHIYDKLIFLCFFIGAIVCLFCSTLFHTLSCHSESISSLFSRLDYAGIAVLTVGSTIPWVYYGFYCEYYTKLTYMVAVIAVGILTVVLTMWEKFNLPDYRTYRAGTFIALGLISGVPCFHHVIYFGWRQAILEASVHCTIIMGALYITGAILYAARIPERFLPGKCDIWFQSHQFFHLLVVAAAFVHYRGISEMAIFRLTKGNNQCQPSTPSLVFE